MKRAGIILFFLAISLSPVTPQINPELVRFWNLLGSEYWNIDTDLFISQHGKNYEKVQLENPFPRADEGDKVWKLLYKGGEFYFYSFQRNDKVVLIYWSLTPEFKFPDRYKSIFYHKIEEIRARFGKEDFWISTDIASYGVFSGAVRFHYNDEKKLIQITWVADFP